MRRLQVGAALLAIFVAAFFGLSACANSLIYHPSDEVVAPNFPRTEAVRIATEDGETLIAWYRAPEEG